MASSAARVFATHVVPDRCAPVTSSGRRRSGVVACEGRSVSAVTSPEIFRSLSRLLDMGTSLTPSPQLLHAQRAVVWNIAAGRRTADLEQMGFATLWGVLYDPVDFRR